MSNSWENISHQLIWAKKTPKYDCICSLKIRFIQNPKLHYALRISPKQKKYNQRRQGMVWPTHQPRAGCRMPLPWTPRWWWTECRPNGFRLEKNIKSQFDVNKKSRKQEGGKQPLKNGSLQLNFQCKKTLRKCAEVWKHFKKMDKSSENMKMQIFQKKW